MSSRYRLPVFITISLLILIFYALYNNVGSDSGLQVYSPEDSRKALESYIVTDADGTSYLNFYSANFKLEPKGDRIVPSVKAVEKVLSESGFYNEELFGSLKIYILPYRVPSIITDNKNVGGFSLVTDTEKIIVIFTTKDKDQEDLQQLVLHELGHIAYQKANQVEMDDYSEWRLANVKSTCQKHEIDGEIIIKEDNFTSYVLDPEEVIAEDFSFVYGESINSPQYADYLASPQNNSDLKTEIRKRLDDLFNNQKVV